MQLAMGRRLAAIAKSGYGGNVHLSTGQSNLENGHEKVDKVDNKFNFIREALNIENFKFSPKIRLF